MIFSGAGLSAESNLATFRDSNGLWANYDPMEVCNFHNWEENFDLVHYFYDLRRGELAKAQPNAMHKFLASLESTLKDKARIIHLTQNVDDLLERAGATHIIHLHGELTRIICPRCKSVFEIGYEAFTRKPCPQCHYEKLKPKIIFFYEQAPLYSTMHEILFSLNRNDALIVIGTSGAVIDISGIISSMQYHTQGIGLKILNNLESSNSIDESVFHRVIYDKASNAIPTIQKDIMAFFG